ncbi:MAG: hypothetical protein WCT40_02795 [Candidatus Magasanikbacteria bacterium]
MSWKCGRHGKVPDGKALAGKKGKRICPQCQQPLYWSQDGSDGAVYHRSEKKKHAA